ncbi:carbohydrate kinase [Izhakiella australiensis]|uniref:Carbohydrate kinase n=1 Tax=Izhakiella australiensis TaxID=1926881 RepID=A0A1S8YQA9_9GAMM|nr:carbohydrate kinase [Izhakiella australiensis]OON41329.1 carbohydrate kinase [Izhakiella australiensis]
MIICCGEALIDMLPRQGADNQLTFAPCVGGSAFNTAIALGRLGLPAGLFSGLSADFMGTMLRTTLAASGVDYTFSTHTPLPTTLAFVRLVDGQANYTFYDENSAGRMLSPQDLPALSDSVQALLFGCISLIAEPCGSVYESLMTREASRRVIFLDPNIRAVFIHDREKHLARMQRMLLLADIVKLSDEDLAWFDEQCDADETVARWLRQGVKIVVVTRGAQGADAWTAQGKLHIPATSVDVVDTVAAGDTVNAGILASLHQQGILSKSALAEITLSQLREAVTLGSRAAAITVSRAGANPPWKAELLALN